MYYVYCRLAARYDILVITPTEPHCEQFDTVQKFKVIRTPRLPLIREKYHTPLLGMLIYALREIFRFRPHQIHCDQIESAFVSKIIASLTNTPYLVYAYGTEIADRKLTNIKTLALSGASSIVTISEYTRRNLSSILNVDKDAVRISYPGVDLNIFHPGVNPGRVRNKYALQGRKVILTVGRLATSARHKGHDTVIRCMPRILKEVPDAVYLIVGGGDNRSRLELLARKVGAYGKVIFAGPLPHEELPPYYAACDIFVMLSREVRTRNGGTLCEGFGIVFLEAGGCGKPVIGGRTGGIPDAVLDGVTGLLVDPNDHNAVVKAIVSILKDGDLAHRLGSQGRKRAEREFTWDDTAEKVTDVIAAIQMQAGG